ncbi:hypothetical protein AVDCRST_MAG92-2192 [uncultured Coleofasciculus sp.]|uniref:Uncharacterized protein n=1 Tax=uncultured Coleofasciculus sp. TaxID=1267456 RepID=A0A6J4IKR9_9CYAN|nr:hypothetical protein AVDCRST_MAG92-2192 [uncultured Coleofasciculus sp.]
MDTLLTATEISNYRQILPDDESSEKVLATLEKYDGRFDDSFDELLGEMGGQKSFDLKRLRKVTLKQLRKEVCGDDSFRTKVQEYSKNPGSAPLLNGLIGSLVLLSNAHGIPLESTIATIAVLYILKIGLNVLCEYTEATDDDSAL